MIAVEHGIRRIRVSALTGYADCPRRAAAKLFPGELQAAGYDLPVLPSGIGAAMGTAVHSAAAVVLTEKAQTGLLPPVSVARDAAHGRLIEGIREGVVFEAKGIQTTQVAEVVVDKMVASYHAEIAPKVQPLIIEERLEATVATDPITGVELVLSGQPDVVAREPSDLRDLKSGKRLTAHGPQVGGYALVAKANGIPVTGAVIDFIPRVGLKAPQPPAITRKYELDVIEQQAIRIIDQIDRDLNTFLVGNDQMRLVAGDPWAFPSNPASMLCSPKYCPAFGTPFCRDHAPVAEED